MRKSGLFERIYAIVALIPPGKVATYGQISMFAGEPNGARIVGYAMHGAPGGLPCHRVVNRLGELAHDGVFGGKGVQREMLEQEGVTFLPNGRIDMKMHRWSGAELL